jgi:hypothetical protein
MVHRSWGNEEYYLISLATGQISLTLNIPQLKFHNNSGVKKIVATGSDATANTVSSKDKRVLWKIKAANNGSCL